MLAMNGVRNRTIMAVEDLVCTSCQRTRTPARPPPAAIPDVGYRQFADAIQMDIVYLRGITGRNYPVLGVIDECTHLHQAAVLENRLPGEVLKKFVRIWAQPFGYPHLSDWTLMMAVSVVSSKSSLTPPELRLTTFLLRHIIASVW